MKVNHVFGSFFRAFMTPRLLLMFIVLLAASPLVAQNSYRDATGGFLKEVTLLSSAARTVTATNQVPIDAGAYDVGNIIVNVTASSGTTPTLLVNFDVCPDATATNCVLHTASASITTTGAYLIKVNQFARYVRISYTIGGTTPSFTFSVYGAFKPST